jgi:hypothetical protein
MLSKSISTLLEKLLDPFLRLFRSSEDETSGDQVSSDRIPRTSMQLIRLFLKNAVHIPALAVVLCILGVMFLGGVGYLLLPPLNILIYVYRAYFRRTSDPSMSCFFMPCSPQSIKDEDQVWSLFAGLFSFLACEAIIPVYKELRRRSREEKEFAESVSGAFKRREGRSVPEHTSGVDGAVELAELRRRATGP